MTVRKSHYQFDDVSVDVLNLCVTLNGELRPLEPKAFRLLQFLIENGGRAVPKDEILAAVWSDATVTDNALTRAVTQVRKALNDDPRDPRYIETVPTVGYRFVAELRNEEPEKPAVLPQASTQRTTSWPRVSAAIAIGLAAFLLWFYFRPKTSRPSAPVGFASNTQLSTSSGLDVNPSFSPDGNLVAYASDRSGHFEIFIRALESGSEIQVTNNGDDNMFPVFSPNGQFITFSSFKKPGIYIVPALGGSVRRLTDFGAQPTWSPDSTQIAFVSLAKSALSTSDYYWPANSSIWLVSPKGGEPRQITSRTTPDGGQTFPSWSLDGREIRFINYHNGAPSLWTYRLADGVLRKRLERPRGTTLGSAIVSPDNRLLYYVNSNPNGAIAIWALHLNAAELSLEGEPEPVFRPGIGVPRDLALSPDGKRLVYSVVLSESKLMTLPMKANLPAGEPREITHETAFRYFSPAWSPDSRGVVYTKVPVGLPPQIWFYHRDGSLTRIVGSGIGQKVPAFSHDGHWLRYVAVLPAGRQRVEEVSVEDGSIHKLVETEELAFPDVSPDGDEVVFQDAQAAFQVWKLRFKDGKRTQLTFGNEPIGYAHYSDDGKWLNLERVKPSGTEILVMPASGGKPESLWNEPGWWLPTGWTPDGDKVLMAGNRGAGWSLYWVSHSSKKLQQLSKELPQRAFVRFARAAPDGSALAYELNESKGNVFLAELNSH